MEKFDVSFYVFGAFAKNGFKKNEKLNGIEVVVTIFSSTRVPVFGREKIPAEMRFEEKKLPFVGSNNKKKFWKSRWLSPLEKERLYRSFLL